MLTKRQKFAVAAVLVGCLLLSTRAAGDPPIRFKTPITVTTEGGSVLNLDPGYYLTLDTWKTLDDEVKRLQESETRLKAENRVFREEAGFRWAPWVVGLAALSVGIATGVYIGKR